MYAHLHNDGNQNNKRYKIHKNIRKYCSLELRLVLSLSRRPNHPIEIYAKNEVHKARICLK